jgi:hypothetical protein
MAFAIPKIQYKNVDTTGNTLNLNATITSIPSTANIEVGMFIRGAGIPTGSTVGSKTATTVTLFSGTATATASGVALAFGYELLFDYPPIETDGESRESNRTISEALSGARQVSVNNTEAKRKIRFSFLSPTKFVEMDTFITTSAILGQEFRYFEDKTLTPYTEFELDELKVIPKKLFSKGVDLYVWEVPLTFRRVL